VKQLQDAGDTAGWLPSARQILSPNFDERPEHEAIRLVVIHAISLPPGVFGGAEIIQLFTNCLDHEAHPYFREIRGLRVSAHFLVRRDGDLVQFVSCFSRAWHAGISSWKGRENCNNFSVGIELEGCDEAPFEDAQYLTLNRLLADLRSRFSIEAVVGHSDIAPGRKTDPGPCFDWNRLHDASR
jgi:AmpD protein